MAMSPERCQPLVRCSSNEREPSTVLLPEVGISRLTFLGRPWGTLHIDSSVRAKGRRKIRKLVVPVTSTKPSAPDETENKLPNKKRRLALKSVDVDKIVFTTVESPKLA